MFRKIFGHSAMVASALLITPIYCKQKKRQVYIWGNGYYQARPDALLQFHNFVPKKISNLPQNLVSLAFSEYYEAGIDDKNNLYIWEKHRMDANVNKDQVDNKRQNIKLIQKNVQSVKFTGGYIWTLTKDNKVYQWPIFKKFNQDQQVIQKNLGEKREVKPLSGSIQIETGRDHIIALNNKGLVYAMGDDTYGQCGQCDTDRNTYPPFTEKRITYPTQVRKISDIAYISSGKDFNLAIDKLGNLYGWGSNSNMQLSHQDQFSKMNNPLICTYTPLRLNKSLDYNQIKKIATGDQFSVIVTENSATKSNEVFSCGSNLKGQLGINQIRHLKDISKIQKLSNYVLKINGKETKVQVQKIQCGNHHCLALLNIGYVMQWGDNQYGQMGNKKRSAVMSPIVLKNFVGKKVVGVFASDNNSGVIVQTEDQK